MYKLVDFLNVLPDFFMYIKIEQYKPTVNILESKFAHVWQRRFRFRINALTTYCSLLCLEHVSAEKLDMGGTAAETAAVTSLMARSKM